MVESLFGHLVSRFSSSPENLATESLNFILNRSHIVRGAFTNLLDHLNILLPSNLRFETQNSSSDDAAIPDLAGKDLNGKVVLLGEAKFWAGLTENQPVTYLKRLIHSNGKLLIFFAPAKRFPTLWPELLRRCHDADLQTRPVATEISEVKIAEIEQNHFLVLMSWRIIVNSFRLALEAEGEKEMLSNLIQLQGLCDQMDEAAFLPLRSEELTGNISSRLLQYCDIVDETTETLVSEGLASTKNLRSAAARGTYVRYMILQNKGCSLEFNSALWNKYRLTPIWLDIKTEKWKYDPEARKRLVSLEMEEPSRLFQEGEALYIPLYLEIGVEKSDVIKNLLAQIHLVVGLLTDEPRET